VANDDWITVGDYPDEACLRVASALLTAMKIPYRIWPTSRRALAQLGQPYIIYVAPDLADEAKRILSESEISDAELAALALASPPPDDV
jgi:hypothetical protein